MFIKQISTKASRTFEVPGVAGRSKYVKIEMGAVGELLEDDNPREEYKKLSSFVQESVKHELQRLNDNIKKTSGVENNGGAIRKKLLG